MIVPETITYHNVNSEATLPHVDSVTINSFCERFEAHRVLAIGKDCYQAGHLQYVRAAHTSHGTYIQSQTKTTFNNVPYTQDILLSSHGDIQETSCECPMGLGPTAHCHHVLTVLFGLQDFSSRKKILTVRGRAQLSLPDQCQFSVLRGGLRKQQKLRNSVEFDPRHKSTVGMPGYVDLVRNLTVAQQLECARMPISCYFPCANVHAIDNDHDYTKKNLEYFFDECENSL